MNHLNIIAISYGSAKCAGTVESDTESDLYKEHFGLENSAVAFRYVNTVVDYDDMLVFRNYDMEKLYISVYGLCNVNGYKCNGVRKFRDCRIHME